MQIVINSDGLLDRWSQNWTTL